MALPAWGLHTLLAQMGPQVATQTRRRNTDTAAICTLLMCWTKGSAKRHLLSWPKLLTFRQGLGLRTPEPWVILPMCPCSLQHTPDSTGLFSCMIFTGWEKLQLSEGEGWKLLQLNFPIFHSEWQREIFAFAHIANAPKLSQGAGRSEEVLEEDRRMRLPGFPGTAWLTLNARKVSEYLPARCQRLPEMHQIRTENIPKVKTLSPALGNSPSLTLAFRTCH